MYEKSNTRMLKPKNQIAQPIPPSKGKLIEYIGLFLATFIIGGIFILGMKGPLSSDEIGHLSSVEYLAGNNWSEYIAAKGIGYYKYGTAVFYLPLYWLLQDRTYLFIAMLVCNNIFISIVPCIIYEIEIKYLRIQEKKMAFSIALMIGNMPSSLIWSKMILSETLLTLLSWLLLLLLIKSFYCNIKWQRYFIGFLLGFLSIWAYGLHVRGSVLTILVLMVIMIMPYWIKAKIANIPCYLGGVLVGIGIDSVLGSYLKGNLWIGDIGYNSVDTVMSAYSNMNILHAQGVKMFLYAFVGWLYSICVSTYGLGIIGIVIVSTIILKCIRKKEVVTDSEAIIYSFSGLYILGAFFLGLIFMLPGIYKIICEDITTRLDQLIYIRYVASAIQFLMFIAAHELIIKKRWRTFAFKSIAIICLINVLFLLFLSGYFNEGSIAIIQLCALPLIPSKNNFVLADVSTFYHQLLIVAKTNMVLAAIIFFKPQKSFIKYIPTGLFLLFVFHYGIWMCNVIYPISHYYYDKIDLVNSFCKEYCIDASANMSIIIDADRIIYPAQYKLYSYDVQRYNSSSIENALIFSEDIKDFRVDTLSDYYILLGNSNYKDYIIVKGEYLYMLLTEKGVNLKKLDPE